LAWLAHYAHHRKRKSRQLASKFLNHNSSGLETPVGEKLEQNFHLLNSLHTLRRPSTGS
jgi:hypothetical protein